MGANGISNLQYKRDRQIAKLNLAASDRAAAGKTNATLDLSLLPTVYGVDDNSPDAIINNPNTGGLVTGRPWVAVDNSQNLVSYATIYRNTSQSMGGRAYRYVAFNTLLEDVSETEPWYQPATNARALYVPSGVNYVHVTWRIFPNYTGDGYMRFQTMVNGGTARDQAGEHSEERGTQGRSDLLAVSPGDRIEARVYVASTKSVSGGVDSIWMSAVGYNI